MRRPFPLDSYITRCLRRVFSWYPPRIAVKEAAQRGKDQYACNTCPDTVLHPRRYIVVDHISPVIDPKKGFEGWDAYVSRLFCGQDNLQALCKACHGKKTKAENAIRRKQRALRRN